MNIPDRAIEAAMVAQYEAERGRDEWVPFEEMPEEILERYQATAALILESGAQHILEPVLNHIAEYLSQPGVLWWSLGRLRVEETDKGTIAQTALPEWIRAQGRRDEAL